MYPRAILLFAMAFSALGLGAAIASGQQQALPYDTVGDTRRALAEAQAQGAAARLRAETLEASARTTTATADRTTAEIAALAARIQQSEAELAANAVRVRLVAAQQARLRARLAERQRPLVQLTAAMQRLSRRPPILALLRPGSLNEAVYLRAVLEAMAPEIARRTSAVRGDIARGRQLHRAIVQANTQLRASETTLAGRRRELAGVAAQQRLAARAASSVADREAERALALAEQARDLSALVVELDKAGTVRAQLAALPGPVLRPAQPGLAQTGEQSSAQIQLLSAIPRQPPAVLPGYLLPVGGRIIAGFGDAAPGRSRSRGLSIAALPFAQVVTPGAGRVAFAGPYRGYGVIVIIEHGGGWTSLITGLGQLDARVGQQVLAGSPLGQAGPGHPVLTLELRRGGEAINPLDMIKG
ncbi:MAG: hypothetical protein RLZZ427_116 [Pseudomonadota bacterium]|jgi:septal ring factor EnvC (AmiA/AmiB activator)